MAFSQLKWDGGSLVEIDGGGLFVETESEGSFVERDGGGSLVETEDVQTFPLRIEGREDKSRLIGLTLKCKSKSYFSFLFFNF